MGPTRAGRRLSTDAVAHLVHKHARTAGCPCPSIKPDHLHTHVLRHTCAMRLLHAGMDSAVIALWIGHADHLRSTDVYLHSDMTIKQNALERAAPTTTPRGRYRSSDPGIAFLESLWP
ncbi:tyrosine-type recombinase/integrase [Actinospica durhamensis]|uniref:Tyrosine-type recombinase/integrase n=1 Tax=Actinospica durhamensis TaxID=1508375 RepID=A0A941IV85_9ACTN|nr:tyrosine-type recombinase/integrase [Actinospica durhamensis]MBR7838783.1 tyrosine-type recombinase/integrase [Actinospica durhamensis]